MTSQTPASGWPEYSNSAYNQLAQHLFAKSDAEIVSIAIAAGVQRERVMEFACRTGPELPIKDVEALAKASGFVHPLAGTGNI
jgi:hypothetical protein